MPHIKLCSLNELNNIDSRGFVLSEVPPERNIFIVREKDVVKGYENSCPHNFASLNWSPDVFLNYDQDYIQCSNHGALFEIHTGRCIYGPCLGLKLQPVELKIENNFIYACL